MFYELFGTQNSMVSFIFKLDPRKDQIHVKLGQMWSTFKIQNFLTQICLSCADLSQNFKNVIYSYVQQLEMLKNAFQRGDVITFTWSSGHCTAKNKDIALQFCVRVVCMYFDHVYADFWLLTFRILLTIIKKNIHFEFWGRNRKISKIRYRHFVERSILRLLDYFDGVLLQNWTF